MYAELRALRNAADYNLTAVITVAEATKAVDMARSLYSRI
jgi:hypothetical protein